MVTVFRIGLMAIAGAVGWLLGLTVFFGPAQLVLSNPDLQSEKFLSVMTGIEPLPRISTHPWLMPLGILVICLVYAIVFTRLPLGGTRLQRGSRFGLVAWALMAPWFEFYLPWNAMREPFALMLLELALWALVLQTVGIAMAFADRWYAVSTPGGDQ